jgi:hypothetical protein
VKLCLPIKRVVRIRTVSDIELLEDGDYGLPTVSNFPFVDAVMKPHYLFQDTLARVPDILAALKKKKTTGSGSVVWSKPWRRITSTTSRGAVVL